MTVLSGAPAFTGLTRLLARTLRAIGYRPTVRSRPIREYFAATLQRPRHDGHIGPGAWIADYPAPSNFLVPGFGCGRPPANQNPGHFCDRRVDALMRRAQRLQISRPAVANRLWAAADRRVIEQAAVVPLSNAIFHDFVSERVGNFQRNLWGAQVDQFWVR